MVHPAVRPAAHACRQRREEGEHCPCKSACARADEGVEERSNSALRQPSVDLQACGAAQAAAAGGNQADAPSQGNAARPRLITCDGVQLSLSTWSQEAQASGSSMAQRDRLFAWGASVFDRIYGLSTVVDGAAGWGGGALLAPLCAVHFVGCMREVPRVLLQPQRIATDCSTHKE